VGTRAIERFLRPVSFHHFLEEALALDYVKPILPESIGWWMACKDAKVATRACFHNGYGGAGRAATCPSPSRASGDEIGREVIRSRYPLRPTDAGAACRSATSSTSPDWITPMPF